MRTLTPYPVTDADSALAEGPIYADGEFAWVDIPAGLLHRATLDVSADRARLDRAATVPVGRHVGSVVPALVGGWLAAASAGFLHLAADGTVTELAQPEAGNPGVRMNDGKCDPAGRFWAGSSGGWDAPTGSLYRTDLDGTVHRVLDGIGISNGLGWSPDGTRMYYVDSTRRTLDVLDYDPASGVPTNRRTLVAFPAPFEPDGLAVDHEGGIWIALWEGSAVHRYTPEGLLEAVVEFPVARPTSCCFADGVLLVTTARADAPHPLAGAVFACDPGVTGPPTVPYAGKLRPAA
ncbi:SMP-30/gluconolactonase/LRE family protein [Longispora sp. NPDC051575]|uniref:SMP-30/gluconolactonase/LRE family protein n=1 Tax=Longispora sp. NPDC051575 TaxID=3154943 RepID=UPI00341E3EFE